MNIRKEEKGKGKNGAGKNQVKDNTVKLTDEEIERMPDTDEDYRLPRKLPEAEVTVPADEEHHFGEDTDGDLVNDDTELSEQELALLDATDHDDSSDESVASNLLDEEDEDGDELNEGRSNSMFDTGEDLDLPDNFTDPDADIDEEKD